MTRLGRFMMIAVLSFSADAALRAQTGQVGVTTPTAAVNVTGIAGAQARGIRAVTRRTVMTTPGQEARTFFTAGGVGLGGNTSAATDSATAAAPATVVAETTMEGLDRPEVRRALRQLANAGDADAKRLLAKPILAARPAGR